LARAEEIEISNGYNKIAVIAGVGVREYYRNNGYNIDSCEGCYQIKLLNNKKSYWENLKILFQIDVMMFRVALIVLGIWFINFLIKYYTLI
jgi:hypothetical protein